jgi:PHS family inorganic phosphate transporter-like MFS transporter
MKDIGGEGKFIPNLLWIFAVFMAIGAGFTLLLPETKGRTLKDIAGEEELE